MNLTHTHRDVEKPLPIGTPTPWGEIKSSFWDGDERHYIFKNGAHFPEYMVREALESKS